MNNNETGKLILKLRKTKGLTQQELAKKLNVTDKAVSRWENGIGLPDITLIPIISEILDTSIASLLIGATNKTDIEIEIKVKLSKQEFFELKEKCDKEATFIRELHQQDTYYSPDFRDFTSEEFPYEWLSIRKRGSKNILNYKHFYPEGAERNTHCDEYEVEIDNIDRMEKILGRLSINSFCTVEKNRIIYMYNDVYEISLDEVKNLGYFIEIEFKNNPTNPVEEYERIVEFSKNWNLDLKNIDRRGYPYHFIDKKNKQ